jgi:hypothetical protein
LLIVVFALAIAVTAGVFVATAAARGSSAAAVAAAAAAAPKLKLLPQSCRRKAAIATAKLPSLPPSCRRQASAATTTLLPRCPPPPPCHHRRRRRAAPKLPPPPNDVTFDAYQPDDIVFYAYFSGAKKNEIGFTQNNLSVRVRSVRLEFLLPPKTNYFPFRFISLICSLLSSSIFIYKSYYVYLFVFFPRAWYNQRPRTPPLSFCSAAANAAVVIIMASFINSLPCMETCICCCQ